MSELFLIVALILVALAAALRYLKRKAGNMASLMATGEVARGHVAKVEKRKLSRADSAFFVRYGFTAADGVDYEREIEVLPNEFSKYTEGQPIDIIYDPRNPDQSVLKDAVDAVRAAAAESAIR